MVAEDASLDLLSASLFLSLPAFVLDDVGRTHYKGMPATPVDGVTRYLAPSVALFEVVDDDLLPLRPLGIQVRTRLSKVESLKKPVRISPCLYPFEKRTTSRFLLERILSEGYDDPPLTAPFESIGISGNQQNYGVSKKTVRVSLIPFLHQSKHQHVRLRKTGTPCFASVTLAITADHGSWLSLL